MNVAHEMGKENRHPGKKPNCGADLKFQKLAFVNKEFKILNTFSSSS